MKKMFSFICLLLYAVIVGLTFSLKVAHSDQRGAIDPAQVMWGAVGAGSKGVVAGLTSGLAPQVGIAPDVITGGLGFGMAQWGRGRLADFGVGMLLASIGQIIRQPIEKLVGGFMPNAVNGNKVTETTGNPTNPSAPSNAEAYLKQRYGIA